MGNICEENISTSTYWITVTWALGNGPGRTNFLHMFDVTASPISTDRQYVHLSRVICGQ